MSTASTGWPSAVRKSVLQRAVAARRLVLGCQRRERNLFAEPRAQLLGERRDLGVPGNAARRRRPDLTHAESRLAGGGQRRLEPVQIHGSETVACVCAPPGEYSTAPTAAKPSRAAASGRSSPARAGRARRQLYMAASAKNFEEGRTQVHQILAVPGDRARSGMPRRPRLAHVVAELARRIGTVGPTRGELVSRGPHAPADYDAA